MQGKTAVVIGGAGILGPVFSAALAGAGADVAMVDKDPPYAIAVALSKEHNVSVKAYAFDLHNLGGLGALVDQIEDELGPIDVLHFNAATKTNNLTAFFAGDESYMPDVWREIMQVNLDSAFYSVMAFGGRMVDRGAGSIIITSSIYGMMGPDQRIYEGAEYLGHEIRSPAVYSASKAGLIGLARHLAAMWGRHGVRVNVLVPGGVGSGQNEVFENKYSNRVPLGRMARAEEMAGALVYLASDASSYVTGQTLSVDGGLSCW